MLINCLEYLSFMPQKKQSLPNNLLLMVGSLLVCLVLIEVILHIVLPYPYLDDPRYGWRLEGPQEINTTIENDKGVWRKVTSTVHHDGFKRWGDLEAEHKAFIIGDSFTQAKHVNNGEEWYAYLEEAFPEYSFFVYGAEGFGNLQEYFILDDYIDEIDPDIIILQVHFNDFINNVYETDSKEYPLGNSHTRPYLEEGEVVYRLPLPYEGLRKTSRLAAYGFRIIDKKKYEEALRRDKETISKEIYGENYAEKNFSDVDIFENTFEKNLRTTRDIYRLIRQRAGDRPIYVFSADDRLQWAEEEATAAANMTYIPDVYDFVYSHDKKGINTQVINDGHWNDKGHKYAGDYLVRYFREQGTFSSASPNPSLILGNPQGTLFSWP